MIRLLSLFVLIAQPIIEAASPATWLLSSTSNYYIETIANWTSNITLYGNESRFMLIDLNSLVRPMYLGQDVRRHLTLDAQFYITQLPKKGKFYQAFRNKPCLNDTNFVYPLSCVWCCGNDFSDTEYLLPGISDPTVLEQASIVPNPNCCSRTTASDNRAFSVGEEIDIAPSKVTIIESGFLWFEPEIGQVGNPYAWFQFQVEYWKSGVPPISAPTNSDSGCRADRAKCEVSSHWCQPANLTCCGRCTNISKTFSVSIQIIPTTKYPQVGFGGHMIALDGENIM